MVKVYPLDRAAVLVHLHQAHRGGYPNPGVLVLGYGVCYVGRETVLGTEVDGLRPLVTNHKVEGACALGGHPKPVAVVLVHTGDEFRR